MIRLHTLSHVSVPAEVAKCPYCGAFLDVGFDEFEQNDDGTWRANQITLECFNSPERYGYMYETERDWHKDITAHQESHSDMPYVHWLPVEERVKAWANATYDFDPDNEDAARPEEAA